MTHFFLIFGSLMLFSALFASFAPVEFSVVLAVCLFIGGIGFLFFGKKYYKISILFGAAVIGLSLISYQFISEIIPARSLDGMTAEISGTVRKVSAAGGNPVFTVDTESIDIDGAPQKITVLLSGWDENSASAFDKISCSVTFRIYSDESLSDFMTNRSGGISVFAYTNSPMEITGKEDSTFRYFIHRIREEISSVIYTYYIDWHAPFTEQLILGTRGELESGISASFRRSGMSHILAISGMHLVVIIGILRAALFSFKGWRRTKQCVLMLAIVLYMFVGGLGMSVLRAGLMLIFRYLARLLFSGAKPSDSLGIAIATVIVIDPFAACDVGFLMSVCSSLALSFFAAPLRDYLLRILRAEGKPFANFFIESFCMSVIAFLAVLPVSAMVFGEISLAAPVSNLFAGFFAEYTIIFGVLTVIFGAVPFLGFLAGGTAFCGMVCGGILLKIAEFFAGFSFSYIKISGDWVYVWIFGAAVLILLPMLISRSFRYLRHSALMCVFLLLAGIFMNHIFYSGVSEIEITALEHGTAISCSNDKNSVLITKNLDTSDRFTLDFSGGYDVFISFSALSSAAEFELADSSEPKAAFLSTEDSAEKYPGGMLLSAGEISISERDFIKIIPDCAAMIETNGATLLYIFSECDIMDIEPKFRRADIIILEGVSPEDFPALRADYLILREYGGFYSGAEEIITLKGGKIGFFAHEGNLKKGRYAG